MLSHKINIKGTMGVRLINHKGDTVIWAVRGGGRRVHNGPRDSIINLRDTGLPTAAGHRPSRLRREGGYRGVHSLTCPHQVYGLLDSFAVRKDNLLARCSEQKEICPLSFERKEENVVFLKQT